MNYDLIAEKRFNKENPAADDGDFQSQFYGIEFFDFCADLCPNGLGKNAYDKLQSENSSNLKIIQKKGVGEGMKTNGADHGRR